MIVSPDKAGRVDGVVHHILKDINTEIPLVPITRLDNFVFNEELRKLDKFVLFDFVELGWDWNMDYSVLFSINATSMPQFQNEEWKKFSDFIGQRQPLYFKRELLKKDVSQYIVPIEYPAFNTVSVVQDKSMFDTRYIDVFFNWGLSHPRRRQIHGEIFLNADKYGYDVVDNFHHIQGACREKENRGLWATINTPHYARLPIQQVLNVQGLAKISVSLGGAGRKCFRHSEAPVNAAMLMWKDEIAWSYDWIDGVNCIKSDEGNEMETLIKALQSDSLYEIYLRGVENCNRYYLPTYQNDYILKTINERI